jgi:AraC-like DNA-binding protein
METLSGRGHATAPLLARVGLRSAQLSRPRARIPFEAAVALFEQAADVAGSDRLGLEFAQTRDVRDMGLLGYVGLSSPTVLDAIRNVVRYRRVFSDGTAVDLEAFERSGDLGVNLRLLVDTPARQHTEFTVALLLCSLRRLTGRSIVPMSATFAHPRREGVGDFERVFGCPVLFGQPATVLTLRRSDLPVPLLRSDDRLLDVLRGQCELVIAAMPKDRPSIVELVERRILDRLGAGDVRMDRVAGALGMSQRTLARRLAEADTTFQAVLETVRHRLAERYLEQDELRLDDVAGLLGYSETSAFLTAFRRWTGTTPRRFRSTRGPTARPHGPARRDGPAPARRGPS